MYDNIFIDFNVIKRHCERNGDGIFEESLVFELLEKYFPKYGSTKSIQKILDMLDAQRINEIIGHDDIGDLMLAYANRAPVKQENIDESSIDADKSESNDGDSIIEVEVPKKIFPFIDLTQGQSHESDEAIKDCSFDDNLKHDESNSNSSVNNSDDNASDNYYHESSDPDIERHVNNDYKTEAKFRDLPMLDFLTSFEDKSDSSIVDQTSNTLETSEILEENNNDPNNNLEGAIFEETTNLDISLAGNNNETIQISDTFGNSNSNNSVIEEMVDSIPGCSKDTDRDVIKRVMNVKSLPSAHSPVNSAPSCRKIFPQATIASDDSDEDDIILDNSSLESDLMCIQEIIPWADTGMIIMLLKKNYTNKNRKELALWELMKEQNHNKNSKRKHNKGYISPPSSPKKSKNLESGNNHSVDVIYESSTKLPSSNQPELQSDLKTLNDSQKNQDKLMPLVNNEQTINLPINKSDVQELSSKSVDHPITKNAPFSNLIHAALLLDDSLPSTSASTQNSAVKKNDKPEQEEPKNPFSQLRTWNKSKDDDDDYCINNLFDFVFKSRTEKSASASPEKSSAIIKPSKLSPVLNPVIARSKLIPNKLSVQPAKLNFLNTFNNNASSTVTKLATLDDMRLLDRKNESSDNVLHRNPMWSPVVAAYQVNKQKIEEPKLIRPSVLRETSSSTAASSIIKAPYLSSNTVNQSQPSRSVKVDLPVLRAAQAAQKIAQTAIATMKTTQTAPTTQPGPSSRLPVSKIEVPKPSAYVPLPATNPEIQKIEVPHTVYIKLRSMFPEVEKSYIKRICANPPMRLGFNDPQIIMNALVDHLLQEGSNHLEVEQMQLYVQEEPVSSMTVDERYESLVEIFPNADPSYLREFVEKPTTTDQQIQDFIQQKIETHDYPTKENYLNKIKITEQLKQYTTNFSVENFLELFPDPVKHFEDPTRKCVHQIVAMEFLKSFFNKYKVCTLTKVYRSQQYNLSLTARMLTIYGPDMKSKRNNCEMPTENIPLLQEIAYVRNKQKILDHIQTIKTQEEQSFKELKDKGLLLTCLCCYNDECMPTKSSECNAGHAFCFECIIRGTEAALADGNSHVRCFTDCQSDISLATLQKVLPPTQFSALLKKRQAAEVAAAEVDGLVSCPFCYFASIPPPEDKVFKCLNPECMKETCRLCKELNHIPLRCDEVIKTDKARRMIEEKMTEALLRTCYQCKKQFYKEEGCNKMRCPCGALMCYVCDRPVKGYDHFNAQGGANSNLCPLWSDDRRLNAEAVRKVAEEVKNSILKQNPNLKIDTEKLLPTVPPKSKGPHDDIPNANQLHEHVRRVANAP